MLAVLLFGSSLCFLHQLQIELFDLQNGVILINVTSVGFLHHLGVIEAVFFDSSIFTLNAIASDSLLFGPTLYTPGLLIHYLLSSLLPLVNSSELVRTDLHHFTVIT